MLHTRDRRICCPSGLMESREGAMIGGETMDAQQTRDQIKQHADAVVRGDMDAVVADSLRACDHTYLRSRSPSRSR
jgi:hypothetical protein